MIKTLIVDDEPFIRQGLKILINWKQYGYEIVGEAGNGLEAIQQLEMQKIDLIIADIKMPEMNGLELIEHVYKNISKDIKFIVLSGFYEFEYAKKAIKCNVHDYILKPIQKEELLNVLITFNKEYTEQKKENEIQKNNEKIVYDRHLRTILSGKYDNNDFEYVRERLNVSDSLRCIIIELNYRREPYLNISNEEKRLGQHQLYDIVTKFLGKNYCSVIFDISKEKDCYDIGFIYSKNLAEEQNLNERQYIYELNQYIKDKQKYDFFVYIGRKVNCIEELEVSYKSANIAKMFSDFSNSNQILYYDEMINEGKLNYILEKKHMDKLMHMIEENDKQGIVECVDKFYNSFKNNFIDLEIIKINIDYLLCNLINIATELDSNTNQEKIMKYISLGIFNDNMSRVSAEHLKEFSFEFSKYLNQLRENTQQGVLCYINKEIAENYMQKLSLKSLSEKYYINSAYLGQIFKKQYNMSFKDYLNTYRIEKAADILKRTDEKIYCIAEKVGYANTDYFINKFVQLKGKTPLQYRKQFQG